MNNRQAWNVITLFLLMIFGVALISLITPKRSFSETENRTLADFPKPEAKDILSGKFERGYEDYLTDQFPWRDWWISLKTHAERAILKKDIHDVYLAKDEYLIEKHTGVFEDERADINLQALSSFAGVMSERFSPDHVSVMIVPNAVDILREKLPPFADPYDEEIYLKKAESMLPEGVWFDAAGILRQHKDEYIYYRTDHHWTTPAASYVFASWARNKLGEPIGEGYFFSQELSDNFMGTIAARTGITSITDVLTWYRPAGSDKIKVTYPSSGAVRDGILDYDKLAARDQYGAFFGGNYDLVSIETDASSGRRLLMFKDSYAHCFAPMLTGLFDRIDMVDLRYYGGDINELILQSDPTDILFLYNAAGFAEDAGIARLASYQSQQ